MEKYLLGIDNGGTMTKAALYDLQGNTVAVSIKKTSMLMPKPSHTERDSDELWEANRHVIQEVIIESKIDSSNIVGISITGHGNGLYLIDEFGNPSYNGIVSTDTRAEEFINLWYENNQYETEILPKTMQSVWAGQPVSLLAWLKKYEPEVLARSRWVLMVKDLIRYRLTGEINLEITDTSGTNLLNVKERKYDRELLRFFGIEEVEEMLPPLVNSTDICGFITEEAAIATGLKEGTPVVGGIFDIVASAIATGLYEEDKLCIVAGTWSINEYITKKPVVDSDLFMTSIYCLPDYYLTTEASPTSASNLEWFIEEFLGQEKGEAASEGRSVYKICNELIEDTHVDESDILFFPYLYGSNSVPHANSCFIGLSSWHKKKHLLRAVYEGIVFGHMYHIERLLKHRDQAPRSCRIAGGVTNSEVWLQMFADTLQLPLEIVEVKEHGTLGTAMCAGVATNIYSSMEEAAEKLIKVKKIIQPDPANVSSYARKYEKFKTTLEKMNPVWES